MCGLNISVRRASTWDVMDRATENKKPLPCIELMLKSEQSKGRNLSWEVVSSLSLEMCKKKAEESWRGSCGRHPCCNSEWGEENQMTLGVPSSPGSRGVSGEQGEGGGVKKEAVMCVHGCVPGTDRKRGEVGGRAESRTVFAMEPGRGSC